jgi:hypothetical protein
MARNVKKNYVTVTFSLVLILLHGHFINHTLRNILYTDINGICPKFNEYDKAKKKLQLILSSSQIMRFTIPLVKIKKFFGFYKLC